MLNYIQAHVPKLCDNCAFNWATFAPAIFLFFVFLIYHSSYLKEILVGISGQTYHDTPWEVERIAEE